MKDPIGSAERDVDAMGLKNSRMAFFLGIGLGYEVLYYMNSYFYSQRTKVLLLVEEDINVFKKALESTDLVDVILRKETVLFVGLEVSDIMLKIFNLLKSLDNLFLIKSVGYIMPSPAIRINGEYYKELLTEYKNTTQAALIRYGDSPQDSLLGESNMFANLNHIIENPGVNLLYSAFKGKPAIVCGSGPSLQKEMELLKQFQGKALIITAESTLWPLSKNGIFPSVVCTLERTERANTNFNDFDYESVKDTYMCAVPVVPPSVYNSFRGPKFNVYRAFAHFNWLPFDKGMLGIGASSANMAFKLAHKMGCNPIILIGQDLCYDRETQATHTEGHHSENKKKSNNTSGNEMELAANDGGIAITNRSWRTFYDNYLNDVPEYHKEVPGGEIINTSEKGVYIPGTVYMPFSQAAEKYLPQEYDPLAIIREKFSTFTPGNVKNDLAKLTKRTDEALSDLDSMLNLCADGWEAVGGYEKKFLDDLNKGDLTPQGKRQLEAAAAEITKKRNDVLQKHKFTFDMLVMHVAQSVYISFGINHEQKLGNIEDADTRNMFIVSDHHSFFVSMAACIEKVKEVVLNGKVVLEELEY